MFNKFLKNKKSKSGEINNYPIPESPIKIPENDTGYNLIKNNYRRFLWMWNKYTDKNKK